MREEFEKWAHQEGLDLTSWTIGYFTTLTNGAFKGWNARQPEIDALKAEVERLRVDAKCLDFISSPGIELRMNDDREDDELFAVFRVTGYPNDREWTALGSGKTVREAINAAMKETK